MLITDQIAFETSALTSIETMGLNKNSGPLRKRPIARIEQIFRQQVTRSPDASAIIDCHALNNHALNNHALDNESTVSFQTLSDRANRLAHGLIDAGLQPGATVGVLVNRSARLPQACLAIYQAGGVYVPLVADHPADRLAYMIAEAGITLVIALDGLELPSEVAEITVIRPEHMDVGPVKSLPERSPPSDLAAILFTSGSTGRPKGVELTHSAVVNMVLGHMEQNGIDETDRILLSSSPGFILGFREVHLTFFSGASHVAISRAQLDEPDQVIAIMEQQRVSVALFTPSYLRLFAGKVPKGLKTLLTAGERPNIDDARHYARYVNYWNCHGSTETCGTYCMYQVTPDQQAPLPSGLPFANTAVLLLNDDGELVDDGQDGWIVVIGAGLAQGYLNRPELTEQSFIQTQWGRAYQTKDLGRWNDKGELIALGRMDDVVKINGQAVSLSEIEQQFKSHENVSHAVALLVDNRLTAVLQSELSTAPGLDYWRGFLANTLPHYMIPAHVLCMKQLPVSSAGKVDRMKIAELAAADFSHRTLGTPAKGDIEIALAAAWCQVLNVPGICREDNFFALGGNSLTAIQVSLKLRDSGYDLPPHSLLSAPILTDQANKASRRRHNPITAADSGLASSLQRDFWTSFKLARDQTGVVITRVLVVAGEVPDNSRWQGAWQTLTERHTSLRTEFFEQNDAILWWRVNPDPAVDFSIVEVDSDDTARSHLDGLFAKPMVMDRAPLARGGLIHVAEGHKTLFWFMLHHGVIDGLSAQVIQNELFDLLCGRQLPPAGNGQALVSGLERDYIDSIEADNDSTFWRETLDQGLGSREGEGFSDYAVDIRRPMEKIKPAAKPFYQQLTPHEVAGLEQLARLHGVGLHSLLLTLLAHEVRRRTGKQTIVIGTALSNQPVTAEVVVGLFVNGVPMVLSKASEASNIGAECQMVQRSMGEVIEHARLPNAEIVRAFRARHPQVRSYRNSLFDIAFTANPSRYNHDRQSGLTFKLWRLNTDVLSPAAGMELAFHHEMLADGGIELGLVWSPEVYHEHTAQNWLAGFADWARWLAADLSRAEQPLPALLPKEAEQLQRWENGPTIVREPQRFNQIFTTLATQAPDKPVVIDGDRQISRGELEAQANRIAHGLICEQVKPGDVVAVLTGCNPTLPAVILAIFKVGGVYLPLALDVPSERHGYMVEDAGAALLIAVEGAEVSAALGQKITGIIRPENISGPDSPVCVAIPDDALAYVIYTSGTTGRPKGVICRHNGLINTIRFTEDAIGFRPDDRAAMLASPGFDASLLELAIGLLLGGALVPIAHKLRDDPWAMKRYYQAVGVTVAIHTPSYIRISRDMPFDTLRVMLVGGEAPSHEDIIGHPPGLRFFNAYGPTETTILVSLNHIPPDFPSHKALPVGAVLANGRICIRALDGTPVPPGVLGEVWLGGLGVGAGYLNKPELTAKQFIQTPEGLHYRTGDLGRWSADGKLEIAGRIDHQVKLHGQRLELEEIEQALMQLDEIAEAVVLVAVAAANTKSLRAFAQLNKGFEAPTAEVWRAKLSEHLPPYMIPIDLTVVAKMPVHGSGKLNRDVLLAMVPEERPDQPLSAPLAGIETQVAEVWHDLLAVEIHREDNFFALNGNSLLAVTIAHRLSKQLNLHVAARDIFAAPTLAGFAQKVAASEPISTDAPQRSDVATIGEREFWIAEKAGLDTRSFIMLIQQEIHGTVPSAEQWDAMWNTVVTRHGAFRSYYREDNEGVLRRRLAPHAPVKLSQTVVADRSVMLATIRQWQSEPLLMAKPPLWRGGVISERATGTTMFWLAMHHAVGDGRSLAIVLQDMAALLAGETLEPITTDLDEAGAAYNRYLAGPAAQQDRDYWQTLMSAVPETAFDEQPLDFAREELKIEGTYRFRATIAQPIAAGLRQIASECEASLHGLMLTLLALETQRRTGRESFLLGTTASLRETIINSDVVGCFVNMLPLPYSQLDGISFEDLLSRTQQDLMAALEHERYPFAQICHEVWQQRPHIRHPIRFPLFDAIVTENPPLEISSELLAGAIMGDDTLAYEFTPWSPGQDMVLIHERHPNGTLALGWHVNAGIYQRSTAQAWFEALVSWARWLGEEPARAKAPLPALLPQEVQQLRDWEIGPVVSRPARCVHELFEQHAASQPEAAAILLADGMITYGQLDGAANRIAHGLLASGLQPGTVVAVLSDRTGQLASAMLGIWKAGGVYLPLAADLPDQRLSEMAQVADAKILLVLDNHPVPPLLAQQISTQLHPPMLASEWPATKPQDVYGVETAYILFTSGSTGKPKGTVVGHDAYLNLVLGTIEEYAMTGADRTLMFSSPSFDVSLADIGVPLAAGASLCPVSMAVLSAPSKMIGLINEQQITIVDLTPSYLRLLDGAPLPSVRILVTGGEAPFAADIATYAPRHRYYNAYGPTENTITSALGLLSAEEDRGFGCGKPLPNTLIEIRADNGQRVPPGAIGEVWLGGSNLAKGYLNRPAETASAFVTIDEGRRYRTGDMGRWRVDGQLELLGRVDQQVKLNGIRVDISEIETAIASHPDVAQATVVVERRADRSHKLLAFIRLGSGKTAPPSSQWPDYLGSRLPAYMIPAAVTVVDDIPVNHAGKIDKPALLAMGDSNDGQDRLTNPSDPLDCLVAKVWCLHLALAVVHLEDNFFSLGGNSLLAITVANDLEKQLGYTVPARELFFVPTLAGFCQRVRLAAQRSVNHHRSSDLAIEGQQEFWIAQQAGYDTRGFNLILTLQAHSRGEVDALPAPNQWASAWKQLVQRHSSLRTSFYEDEQGRLRTRLSEAVSDTLTLSHGRDFEQVREQIASAQAVAFDMLKGPLWRAGLVLLETGGIVFWLSLHHGIADGWSLGVLTADLEAALRGNPLTVAPHSFAITAAQEFDYLHGTDDGTDSQPDSQPDSEADRIYWQESLAKLVASGKARNDGEGVGDGGAFDEWPLDFPRRTKLKAAPAKGKHCFRVRLNSDTVNGLRTLAQRNGATLHCLMLTLMALEINRRSDRPAFALGTVASRRETLAEAAAVGYYINMLPIACAIDRRQSIDEAIRTMQHNLAQSLKHQRYPFTAICRDFSAMTAGVTRHPTRLPIFDFAVTENPALTVSDTATDWSFVPPRLNSAEGMHYELRALGPAQDMVLIHQGCQNGDHDLMLVVNAKIYRKTTAEAWLNAITHWAVGLGQGAIDSTEALPALTVPEANWLANRHGQQRRWPAKTFHEAFTRMAQQYPQQPALITPSGNISYQAMDRLTDTLAQQLITAGAVRGRAVAVLTERSVNLPQTALAIFKAGAVYLPLTVSLPEDRLAFMCQDADPALLVVLDDHPIPPKLAHLTVFDPHTVAAPGLSEVPEQLSLPDVTGQEVAYIIYTSGSTGAPKGVLNTHQGLNNFAHGVAEKLGIDQTDKALLSASPSFDAWISDLGMCWVKGAGILPITRQQLNDIDQIKQQMADFGITYATLPPSYLRLFNQTQLASLKKLMTVGEPPLASDVAYYGQQITYFNGYGPTENTGATAIGVLGNDSNASDDNDDGEVLSIHAGTPIANVTVHLLSPQQRPVPPGTLGHIWVGGESLGAGYLNLADKTQEVFVETALGRLYYTGDLGRWNAQGMLEIAGRVDKQVKLRGQRVELGEIEARLEQWPGVNQAVALVQTASDGTQTLWAFVIFDRTASEPSQSTWQDFLGQTLPSYMIPAAVIGIDKMPFTPAGKIAADTLLQQVAGLNQLTDEYDAINRTAPANDTEARIAQVWQSQFPGRKIAREDDFFALGGDSLRVIAVINALRVDYQCDVNELYENPVLADFARCCQCRPAHLLHQINAAKRDWQGHLANLEHYEAELNRSLDQPLTDYQQRNIAYDPLDLTAKRDYQALILTGATGYLGAYLLRELLATPASQITALVRGADDDRARVRLEQVLQLYFGAEAGHQLANDPRLRVLAADLRQDQLGLSEASYEQLAQTTDAIYHCAANVNHFGHYHELYANNVTATQRLIDLAATRSADPADFHHVSTISVAGTPPETGFALFSEYTPVPEQPANNYYIRTKQEAERVVIAARGRLRNATIHRVGNVVFAADAPILQKGVKTNAFFRQLASFIKVGKAPDDLHVWLCHVDYLAQALVNISLVQALENETHHLEHHHRHGISELLTNDSAANGGVKAAGFSEFLDRLIEIAEDAQYSEPLAELVEGFGLVRGRAPQPRGRRLEVITQRTQSILTRLGFTWPDIPVEGLRLLLNNAQDHFWDDHHQTNNDKRGK